MRIERLQIHGFGRMKEQDITIKSGITVFMGPNEAGKSTLMQFVRAMLFGIPSRTYPTERYEPLAGGVHGGVLNVIDEDGARWTVSRFATSGDASTGSGTRLEKLTIVKTDEHGQVRNFTQQDMERELLGGMSREIFNQLFAISLSELQEIRTLQSDEMSSYLFHAGIGGGGEIIQAERKLVQDMEKIYKPKGRVQEIAKVLQSMEQLERDIVESRSFLQRYNVNVITLNETVQILHQEEKARHKQSLKLQLLKKAKEIRPMWLKWSEAMMEHASYPLVSSFPEDGVRRWESLEGEEKAASLRHTQLLRIQEELHTQLDNLPRDEQLEEQGSVIERLSNRRESYEVRKRDWGETKAEATSLDKRLTHILRQINPAWSRNELQKFSTSVGERESVRRYAVGFASYDRRIESLGQETQQLRRQVDLAEDDYRKARQITKEEEDTGRSRFAMMVPHSPQEMATLWNELQGAVERWRENRILRLSASGQVDNEVDIKRRMKNMYLNLLWGSGILTIVTPILVLWSMGSMKATVSIGSLLLIVDVILLWNVVMKSSPPQVKRSELSHITDEATELERITKLMSLLITDPLNAAGSEGYKRNSVDAGVLESSIRELRKMMDVWQSWQQKLDKLYAEQKVCQERVHVLSRELSRLGESIAKEERTFEELEESWGNWLQDRELNDQLSPEAVLDMFGLAEQGLENIDNLDNLRRKEYQLEQDCLDYEHDISSLLPTGVENKDLSPGAWIELKKKEWIDYQEVLRKRDGLLSRLEAVHEDAKLITDDLQRISALMQELMMEGEANSREDFLRSGRIYSRRQELSGTIRQFGIVMFSGSDERRKEEILHVLNMQDEMELELACNNDELIMNEIEIRWNELQQQHGRLLQEKDQLELLCLHDTALQQLEEQKAALKEMTSNYAVMSICAELISRTRRVYEEEKQPQVLKMASIYFERLTNGAYTRIVMKLGAKELLAEHRNSGLIDSGKLSRGTAEQMYLAMRFALANTMNTTTAIPLLFDDIFVNFDEERMISALSLLQEISLNRQIIMMTCHPYVVKHIQSIDPTVNVISLQPSV
ncbi:AAA family ATPase [Paenibacillus antarcticus]|uniref:YhaN AAA domain-containing protein n=1 Tax=Paenibacillus antarcticus TaxID=253703 RepID=A0A162MFN8_9BACL|nr:AAA family ATPase [Paenibacillus antarcticus]OAB43673.1 hypothetical protein PBAT_17570 [Paenibacillus antarcticus]